MGLPLTQPRPAVAHLRATIARPTGTLQSTRWLFAILALLSVALGMVAALVTARDPQIWFIVAGAMTLAASMTAGYLTRSAPPLADALDAAAVFAFTLANEVPSGTFAILFAAVWFRSLYGTAWGAARRTVGYSAALLAATALWPHVFGRTSAGESMHVALSLPTLFLTFVVARRLATSLAEREVAQRVGHVYATATAELIGNTDDRQIRRIAWRADDALCRELPGLRIVKLDVHGQRLVPDGSRGSWTREPTDVPVGAVGDVLAGLGANVHAVTDPRPLDEAAGQRCAWLALRLPVVDRLGETSWLIVGAPNGVPEPVLTALTNLANHLALAYAVAHAHSELTTQATTDHLTGLANRAAFTAALEACLADADTFEVSVLFIDLDDFKDVNDTFGHAVGDEVLSEVAGRLVRATRPGDVCARLGGDEFAVLLPGVGQTAAVAAAQRMSEAIAAPLRRAGDLLVPVSASVGCATVPAGTPAEGLLRRADAAMYSAKASRSAA